MIPSLVTPHCSMTVEALELLSGYKNHMKAAFTDLKPLVLLPSKARTIVHVPDKQCA